MADFRLPGPADGSRQRSIVDDGTLMRRASMPPGSLRGTIATQADEFDPWILLRRAGCVKEAAERARGRVPAVVLRETGEAIEALIEGLLPGLLMMMAVLGVSVGIGGAAGAAIGLLAGGVGALPGAAIGAKAGASVGIWLLTWLGLGFLAVEIGRGLVELGGRCMDAVRIAWDAHGQNDREARIDRAADGLAEAVALLLKLILMAIVARLTMSQAGAAGRSAASSVDEIVAALRQSRLGAGFADWVAANAARLTRNPKLQMHRQVQGTQAVSEAQTPSQMKKAGKADDAAEAAPKPQPMKRKEVCFKNGTQAPDAEFDRQLAGQEAGLNDLSVQEYLDGRARYEDIGRQGTGKAQAAARAQYSQELTDQFVKDLRRQGIRGVEAQQRAAQMAADQMKSLAALHNPDLKAGGKDVITAMGDKRVNQSIGSQWKSRVNDLDMAAKEVPEHARASTKMNTKLKRC